METLKCGVKYSLELLNNIRNSANSLKDVSESKRVSDYLIKNYSFSGAATDLVGSMFYDMSLGDEEVQKERNFVGKISSRLIILADLTDDILDKRPTSLDEKFRFFDNVTMNLFGHESHSSPDLEEQSSYSLAKSIHRDFISKYKNAKFKKISDELVDTIKRQFTEQDKDELLEISKIIGSCCTDSTAVLAEIVTGKDYHDVRNAANKIGEYSALLDNLYEIDNDLEEGVNTYPTVRIGEEGDTSSVRKDIKNKMLSIANNSFIEGLEHLDEKNKSIYKVLKGFVDLKYKVLRL